MTKGIREGEPDARKVYADIIDLPHHRSSKHPPMSLYDRAAQFAPFAALSGYEDMVHEETRLVDRRIELTDEEIEINSRKLSRIAEAIRSGEKPVLSVTYFVPDPMKAGGTYETIRKPIRKVQKAAAGALKPSSGHLMNRAVMHTASSCAMRRRRSGARP